MHRYLGCLGTQLTAAGCLLGAALGPPLVAVASGVLTRGQLAGLVAADVAICGFGFWVIARTIILPVDSLRREVLVRAQAAVPRADLSLARRDELGELARAFNALLEALRERGRATEELLADVAHELKSPIAAVRSCAEQMQDPAGTTREVRIASVLERSAARLEGLVAGFLDLARAESGLPEERRTVVDLGAMARSLVRELSAQVAGAGASVSLEAEGEPVAVNAVPERLESAVRALLDNAISFAAAGGSVRVTVRMDERRALLAVSDDGPGISAEDLPRVFERFFTTRRDSRGTGLGLAMARAVVEAHGGTITASSIPGSGATFQVSLPVAARR